MNKKFNKFSIILLIILMITAISIGCQPDKEEPGDNDNAEDNGNVDGDNGNIEDNGDINDDNDIVDDAEEDVDDMNGNGENEDIANSIVEMDGINDATVVVRDDTAIVGIDAVDTADGEISQELRDDIEAKVKERNQEIDDIYISSETDFFDRINKVSEDIRRGDPIDEFTDELDDLIDALTPDTQD